MTSRKQTHHLKAGDTREPLRATLKDRHGDPVDLSTAREVRLQIERPREASIDKVATIVGDGTGGEVRYDWDVEDTEVPGTFRAEIRVEFLDDTVLTFPNTGYFTVEVSSHA